MGAFSIWHLLIVLVVIVVLFGGRGKISSLMGDTAKGIRAFKDGLKNEDDPAKPAKPMASVEAEMVLRPPWTPEMMSEEAKAALGYF